MSKIMFLIFVSGVILSLNVRAGGISDGGGNLTSPTPLLEARIENAIDQSGLTVLTWLNQKGLDWQKWSESQKSETPLKIFFTNTDLRLQEFIRSINLIIKKDGPCYSSSGEHKDASVDFSANLNKICLSTYMISQRASSENIDAQVSALLVHEIAHLMGANENEAQKIQNIALEDFAKFKPLIIETNISKVISKVDLFTKVLDLWAQNPERDFSYKDCFMLVKDLMQIKELSINQYNIYSLIDKNTFYKFNSLFPRLSVILMFTGSKEIKFEDFERNAYKTTLNEQFKGSSTKTIRELIEAIKIGGLNPNEYEDDLVRKPQSWDDIQKELILIKDKLNDLYLNLNELHSFKFKM